MPHLLRMNRDLEARLDRLAKATGLGKAALIERCLEEGAEALETQLMLEETPVPRADRSIDQLLRESGLGA